MGVTIKLKILAFIRYHTKKNDLVKVGIGICLQMIGIDLWPDMMVALYINEIATQVFAEFLVCFTLP